MKIQIESISGKLPADIGIVTEDKEDFVEVKTIEDLMAICNAANDGVILWPPIQNDIIKNKKTWRLEIYDDWRE